MLRTPNRMAKAAMKPVTKSAVLLQKLAAWATHARQRVVAARHCLELQPDIGRHADDRDDGDQRRDQPGSCSSVRR